MFIQAIGVHGLSSVELEVLEVGEQLLLDVGLRALLESGDFLGSDTLLLKSTLDSLQVACFITNVSLLRVERRTPVLGISWLCTYP